MKNLTKMFLGTATGLFLAQGSALADFNGSAAWHFDPSLIGSWQFEMTVRADATDCTTSPPITFGPNPFPALISFHEGGTLNEYASRTPPSVRTTGFGSWVQTGRYRYTARYTFMEFDANGLLWRSMVIESRIRLDNQGNNYTAVSRLELTDISGNAVKLCATADAVRFSP